MKKIASMNKSEALEMLQKIAKLQDKLLNKIAQDSNITAEVKDGDNRVVVPVGSTLTITGAENFHLSGVGDSSDETGLTYIENRSARMTRYGVGNEKFKANKVGTYTIKGSLYMNMKSEKPEEAKFTLTVKVK